MLRFFAVVFGLALLLPVQAEVYRWTDENGRVHYGTHPSVEDATRIEVPVSAPTARDLPVDEAERHERRRRMLEAFEYERERKAEQSAREAKQARRRAGECKRLRAHWRRLNYAGPIYFSDGDGERRYLDDAERAAEKARLRPFYEAACGTSPD